MALLVVGLLVACKGGGDGDTLTLEEALEAMMLQPEDLPEGFQKFDSVFSTTEEAAQGSEERKDLLESWGRLLGLDVSFQPVTTGGEAPTVRGINMSASLYKTEEGASQSFADAKATADSSDWQTTYAGLRDFKQEGIDASGRADEIGWLRFSGFQPAETPPDALVTDDLIYFRVGRERGFLRVLASSTTTTDRAYLHDTVDAWLVAMVDRVRDALERDIEEAG
jgi:hypothetical protein